MTKFTIEYEDAKKILALFYNSPYGNIAGYVEIMHALKETDSEITLQQKIGLERALNAQLGVLPPNEVNDKAKAE